MDDQRTLNEKVADLLKHSEDLARRLAALEAKAAKEPPAKDAPRPHHPKG